MNRKLILIICIFSFLFFSFLVDSIPNIKHLKESNNVNIKASSSDDYNILEFWKREMKRVNETDLDIEFGNNYTLDYINQYTDKRYKFKAQEITFKSPNWVDVIPSAISIYGYLLYPEEEKGTHPGCICMHGLNGNANQSFEIAYDYLEKDFIVLTFDFPGHGKSGGPLPSHKNFYYQRKFNESSILYLTICSAIQGLRVLENLTIVNNSKIMVAGGSFGALNTFYLSGICGERIAGCQPIGAVGDIKSALVDPTKLIFWLFDKSPDEIDESFWNNQARRIDPKYYLKSENLPPILLMISTNDEFFHYRQINGTFDAIKHNTKFLQIYPNGHHSITTYHNVSKFFIDYIIYHDSAPPSIDVKSHHIEASLTGDVLKVRVEIKSEAEIKSVQVCYKYLDFVGVAWTRANLEKKDNDIWQGSVLPGAITSELDYFIIVNLKGDNHIWFTSKICTAGILISYFTIPFYISIIAFISLPLILFVRDRYKKDVLAQELQIQQKAKKYLFIELALIGIIEALFYISFFLPFVVLEAGGIIWTHFYFLNNVFTWEQYFGFTVTFLAFAFILGWIAYSQLSIKKPILMGIIKVLYPLMCFALFGYYMVRLNSPTTSSSAQILGAGYPGIGMYMMLFSSIAIIILGIWKRKYQKKLGIKRIKKTLSCRQEMQGD
ncbi:MAG: alpha/beta fold hydrolase [Promethearchaeota archaeon]